MKKHAHILFSVAMLWINHFRQYRNLLLDGSFLSVACWCEHYFSKVKWSHPVTSTETRAVDSWESLKHGSIMQHVNYQGWKKLIETDVQTLGCNKAVYTHPPAFFSPRPLPLPQIWALRGKRTFLCFQWFQGCWDGPYCHLQSMLTTSWAVYKCWGLILSDWAMMNGWYHLAVFGLLCQQLSLLRCSK